MKWRVAAIATIVACSGCMTAQMYDGPRRESDELARISGDLRITAGAPLSIILRQVDGQPLTLGQNAVDVLPGAHHLLVDCRIAETANVTRHSIDAEVSAGRHYKLAAQTGPGLRECTSVTLQTGDF